LRLRVKPREGSAANTRGASNSAGKALVGAVVGEKEGARVGLELGARVGVAVGAVGAERGRVWGRERGVVRPETHSKLRRNG
jgi:hypothetical protein